MLLPSEIIKAKTQVVIGKPTSSQAILREMMKKQGVKSLFVGLDAQLARDSSFYALFFGGYEFFGYMFRTNFPSMPNELNYFLRYDPVFWNLFGVVVAKLGRKRANTYDNHSAPVNVSHSC